MLPPVIVFDFDLTLADSSAGFVVCHDVAASSLGLARPTKAAIMRTIGTPLPLAFRQLYGVQDEVTADTYISLYQQQADEVMTGLTVMLPGANATVKALGAAGVRMGIVSQKLRYRIVEVLRREGLLELFGVVLGGEDMPAFKPDPRGILLTVELLGGEPARSLYVGDTVIDAEAAKRAGTPFVAVLAGETRLEEFAGYKLVAAVDSVAALPELLAGDWSAV